MKILSIGGTGNISTAVTRQLARQGHELYLINRGSRNSELPPDVHCITADISDEQAVAQKLKELEFDAVCDFIGFVPAQMERNFRLFAGRTKQFVFISSASAYGKPVRDYIITEGTTLANPYWEYSRNKIACEEYLLRQYREHGFPVTIVRPSHTYGERWVPVGIHGKNGCWAVLQRMLSGKPIIVQGDGTSLWTMTHSTDFAKGFIGLLGNPHAIGEAFHITSDETLTWNQIYQAIADSLNVPYKPYHVASGFLAAVSDYDLEGGLLGDKANSVVFDNSKLKRAVPGFQATVCFETGIRETIGCMLAHKEYQTEDAEFDAWCDRVIDVLENAKRELRR